MRKRGLFYEMSHPGIGLKLAAGLTALEAGRVLPAGHTPPHGTSPPTRSLGDPNKLS